MVYNDNNISNRSETVISPSPETKSLGAIVDSKLTFSSRIDFIVSMCNSIDCF